MTTQRDQPWLQCVGDAEPCDWCGRPGTVEQFDAWEEGTLVFRNPALCPVCSAWWRLSADAIDAIYESNSIDWGDVMEPFEHALKRKWREKVAVGRRLPQGAEVPDGIALDTWRPTTPRPIFFRAEVGAPSPLWGPRDDGSQGIIDLENLALPLDLCARLEAWASAASETDDPELDSKGHSLMAEVQSHLPGTEVIWDPDR